jgi:exodeoxyribonuclease VIII
MNTYAYLIKAKAKAAEAKSLFCWFSAKSDSRADRKILDILEDADIETGRGADHQLPTRTNWFVVDDLPEEGVLDNTWCDRYELDTDGASWKKIVTTEAPVQEPEHEQTIPTEEGSIYALAQLPFRMQLLAQFIAEDKHVFYINWPQRNQIADLEMDTDNHYVQNLLLAAENVPQVKEYDMHGLWKITNAIKQVFPVEKRQELGMLIQFLKLWIETDHLNRGILVREWAKGNRISSVHRTDSGANAGGGNPTDRNPELTHTFESLDVEIALATLPMDFNIYDLPGSVYRRAKEIVKKKEKPFAEWSAALRSTPGILDYSRAAIFALIRSAPDDVHYYPQSLRTYISANLAETDHENPSEETLTAARHTPEKDDVEEVTRLESESTSSNQAQQCAQQPHVERISAGVFSIEGLTISATSSLEEHSAEKTSNVSVEETGDDEAQNSHGVLEGEATDHSIESDIAVTGQIDTVNNDSGHQNIEPADIPLTQLMVDIESMGKGSDAPVVSIGAVFFDPATGRLGPDFYKVISLESAMAWGGAPDASTIVWWLKQSSEARSAIAMDDTIPLDDALLQLNDFIFENAANGAGTVEVWGNGATFDNVILRNSYSRTGINCPWKFTNDRDVRTIVALGKAVGCEPRHQIPFDGDAHNALADARHQAKYVSAIWQRLTAN